MAAQRPQPKIRAFNCPNCGNSMQLKGMGTSLSAVCPSCLSILDTSDERVKLLQRAAKKMERFEPKIPLGTRGKIDGKQYEVTGFQHRTIMADGVEYGWDEYVLYNPFHGFRYLTEYTGHWNDIVPVLALPAPSDVMGHAAVAYDNRKFKLFQTSNPTTKFVLGEFPWRVKLNDTVNAKDYVDPPYSLASETDSNETTWSRAQYISGKEIWTAFNLKGSPPAAQGVYSNQPNPYGSTKGMWALMAVFSILLLVTMIITSMMASGSTVFQSKYYFVPGMGEPSFVTPSFEMKGGEKNVEVEIRTDLQNDWMYLGLALINEDTGVAYDFGKEVSYYSGTDSDGSWSEGDKADSVSIGAVPGGKYYLRVEPDMEKIPGNEVFGTKRVNYEIKVRRDVAVIWPYFVVWPFLLIPPLFAMLRRYSFEGKRWAESDPSGNAAFASSEDEEDDE
jgi:hypothetical protein